MSFSFTFRTVPELHPNFYGLPNATQHELWGIINSWKSAANTEEVVEQLEKLYCSHIGVEFMHLESAEEREWFAIEFEALAMQDIEPEIKRENAKAMVLSQNFDHFVGTKFPTVKRYGGEGAESCFPFYREIFRLASTDGVQDVFMCMAHRGKSNVSSLFFFYFLPKSLFSTGRLNLLTGMLNCPNELMFSKMKGRSELPAGTKGNFVMRNSQNMYSDSFSHTFRNRRRAISSL